MVCFHFTVSGPILFEALFSEETVELAYSCVYILLCPLHIHSAADLRWTELSFQMLERTFKHLWGSAASFLTCM